MSDSFTLKNTPYPLITLLGALLMLAYFYLSLHPELALFYGVPNVVFATPVPEGIMAGFALVLLVEMRYIQSRRQQQKATLNRLKAQVDELLENKKQLNAKAHVYASHADKLKLFISDKLLEYIEYDEKFLHFKSIASEVRHNGVICYDKIQKALEEQMDNTQLGESDTYEGLRDARDSLRYLWDLLDLSTADNIALHIANQVCESEEYCFQSELNGEDTDVPDKPLFDPRAILVKALARCFGCEPEWDDSGTLSIPDQKQVWIHCDRADELLGNENHIILALENIIHNAQFYNGRRGSRRSEKRSRIAITLDQMGEYVRYAVYNRGQPIDTDTASKLFQLGYSTRRAKEHHGKGLGLYFVSEIIKGYDGRVSFENIMNRPDVVSLRLELSNGEVITDVIELVTDGEDIKCRKSGGDAAVDELVWDLSGGLQSIEVTHQSDQATHRIVQDAFTSGGVSDPAQPAQPRWRMDYENAKRASTLKFQPLDVAGVQFVIKLPTFNARVEGNLLTADELDIDSQVESFSRQFEVPEGVVSINGPRR